MGHWECVSPESADPPPSLVAVPMMRLGPLPSDTTLLTSLGVSAAKQNLLQSRGGFNRWILFSWSLELVGS